mmetsp:Transcript_4993/g.11716  ORF Transcript_4993/g.11716 Transcript_4993/m.11716 type:complete len:97 (+) Transcript_4993:129-419(+)
MLGPERGSSEQARAQLDVSFFGPSFMHDRQRQQPPRQWWQRRRRQWAATVPTQTCGNFVSGPMASSSVTDSVVCQIHAEKRFSRETLLRLKEAIRC